MGRKCSHCGHNGHNSRTCITPKGFPGGGGNDGAGVRLFGVQLHMTSPMNNGFIMDCFSYAHAAAAATSSSASSSSSSLVSIDEATEKASNGYVSDGLVGRPQERRKGVPWSEEEHRLFLAGLEKLGKGDWRGISRNFVTTRTPTQVASHAQKHFLRQHSLSKRKRRSSLFDAVPNSERTSDQSSDPIYRQLDSTSYLSPNIASHAAAEISAIDLNSTDEEYSVLPSSHAPICFFSPFPQSSFDQMHNSYSQLSPVDLELSISAPRQTSEQAIE